MTATLPLWAFSTEVYGRPGVAESCLWLQDNLGVDVPVLLFSAWLGAAGQDLDGAAIDAVAAQMQVWSDTVIRPLRAVRRGLKGIADWPEAESLRALVKQAELEAERQALGKLESLAGLAVPSAPGSIAKNIERIVAHYGSRPLDAAAMAQVRIIAEQVRLLVEGPPPPLPSSA